MLNSIKKNNNISIVTITDNHYVVLLAALLKSLEINHKTDEIIDVYLVGDNLSITNQNMLKESITSSIINIIFHDKSEVIPAGITLPVDRSSYPLNIYFRLFIPFFLPKDVVKVIYLDVDMLVLEDISLLWDMDLQGNIVAAVRDPINIVSNPWGGIKNYSDFNMDQNAAYFNTGLLLIDKVKWINFDVTSKVLSCIRSNKAYANFPDQYGLNIILYQKWLEISPLWNCFSHLTYDKPSIIHFNHRKPIYKSYNKNKLYKMLFFDYLNKTRWAGFEPIGELERYLKKMWNVLEKTIRI